MTDPATCNACDTELGRVVLIDNSVPYSPLAWCSWPCAQKGLDRCSTNTARASILATVWANLIAQRDEMEAIAPEAIEDIEPLIRESLHQHLIAVQSEER